MARELATRINRERARGIDVIEEHKAQKHRERTAALQNATNSFGAAVREFFIDHRTDDGRPARAAGAVTRGCWASTGRATATPRRPSRR